MKIGDAVISFPVEPLGRSTMATIGIDASTANALERTGAEWYAYHLIQALKNLETPELEFVLYSREPLRDGLERLPPNWSSRVLAWNSLPFWRQLGLSWELLRHPVDLLFHPTHSIPLYHPRQVVVTLHDVGFERMPELYSVADLRYHRPMARRAVRIAQRVLTVSEFSRREIVAIYHADPARVVVTPNAVDPEVYHGSIPDATTSAVRKQLGVSGPFLLYLGRPELKKNLANILSAFEWIKQHRGWSDPLKLVLAGSLNHGPDRQPALATSKLKPHLVTLGYVPESELPGLIAAATALVFPSRYEGFGIPILQAQAVGTPVITSDRGAMRETAGAGAMLVDPDDIAAIAAAMMLVLDDPARRAALRAAGFDNVKRYSWDVTARLTLSVFRELLAEGTKASPSDRI